MFKVKNNRDKKINLLELQLSLQGEQTENFGKIVGLVYLLYSFFVLKIE